MEYRCSLLQPSKKLEGEKPKGKKVTPASAVMKKESEKVVNSLFQKRPKNFGIRQNIQPKRDLMHFVQLQQQRALLYKCLKVPLTITQFAQDLGLGQPHS